MELFDRFKKSTSRSSEKPSHAAPQVTQSVGERGRQYRVGDHIGGRYQVYRILGGEGQSGMGVVYVCLDREPRDVLALKTFQDKYLSNKAHKDAFEKAALAWIRLERHPYIVRALWVQELESRLFVGVEFVPHDDAGRNTLTHYLRSPVSLRQALTWGIQFCHGMEYAVSKGVTPHRDIKPDNLMIAGDGVLKITDFGLAGIWDGVGFEPGMVRADAFGRPGMTFMRTPSGKVIAGTPPWMAPEQFDGDTDELSDMYAFGVILYQMDKGGRLPYQPEGDRLCDSPAWRAIHCESTVPRFDSPLCPVVEKCLRKQPAERYQGFAELRRDLEDIFEANVTRLTGEKIPSPPGKTELEAPALVNKGISLGNLGLVDEEITAYRRAIGIDPDLAEAHYNLGIALKGKGLIDEAIRECREAVRIKPDHAHVHCNLGVALSAKGLIDEEITAYRKAIGIDPDLAEAHYNLGIALEGKGLIDEAIRAYRRAIGIDPGYGNAHNNLGIALKGKGLIDEAIRECREAVRIKPDHAHVHCNLGNALKAKGLIDDAITAYRKAIGIDPDLAEAHNNLGIALKGKGLVDEAIRECREAVRIKPDYADAHYHLGNALKAKGLIDDAIKEYRKAVRMKPDHADAHYHLGNALKAKGLHDEAIKPYENFIRCAPPSYAERVVQVRQTIRELKGSR